MIEEAPARGFFWLIRTAAIEIRIGLKFCVAVQHSGKVAGFGRKLKASVIVQLFGVFA